MSRAATPVARLTAPGEIAAALPHLCGFVPRESVVLLSLRGARRRVGLVIRLDLGPAAREQQDADQLVARLLTDAPREALVVVCTEETGDRPRAELVARLAQTCGQEGVTVREALLVRDRRWSSYTCDSSICCPPEGTPVVDASSSRAVGLLAAESVLAGRQVLLNRAALAQTLQPPQLLAAAAGQRAVLAAQHRRDLRLVGEDGKHGAAALPAQDLAAWSGALDRAQNGTLPGLTEAAELAAALAAPGTRDEVLTWAVDRSEAMLSLLHQLASLVPAPWDAAICTMMAVTSWSRGDGALANIALDRALLSVPDYGLAVLTRAGLDAALPPAAVRRWLTLSGRVSGAR